MSDVDGNGHGNGDRDQGGYRKGREGDGGLERIARAEGVLGRVARRFRGWGETESAIGRAEEALGMGLSH